jgi:redox-sensitive bicupin YhaK (pirin superfamily)
MRELIRKAEQVNTRAPLRSNKPVLGGRLPNGTPTSSLFYWSHTTSTEGFEFGLHGHRGFEILTFVLQGENAHYDTATRRWTPLRPGDFQVISSGSGLQHSERLGRHTEGFQLWFDPDFQHALARPPTYVDHSAAEMRPVVECHLR